MAPYAGVAFPTAAVIALASSFLLVSRLERLAGRWHLPEAALGLMVAFAADSPEITSAITASAHGQRTIGAGVVLGSNVFNLAALLGLGAIVARRIELHRRVVLFEGAVALWVALVAVIVLAAGLDVLVGLVLVLVVVVPYVVVSVSRTAGLANVAVPPRVVGWLRRAVTEEELELRQAIRQTQARRFDVLVAALSMAVVVGSSTVMERTGATLGKTLHISPLVLGGVVLAAVTSLPNAVGAVYLARRGRGSAVLSEAMNSNTLNVVIGLLLPGIFIGISGRSANGVLVASWYAALCVISLVIAYAFRGINRAWGVVIVLGYLLFLGVAVTR